MVNFLFVLIEINGTNRVSSAPIQQDCYVFDVVSSGCIYCSAAETIYIWSTNSMMIFFLLFVNRKTLFLYTEVVNKIYLFAIIINDCDAMMLSQSLMITTGYSK